MKLDLNTVPFSRAGSYLAFTLVEDRDLYLKTVHGGHENILKIQLVKNDKAISYEIEARPTRLNLKSSTGEVLIFIDQDNLVRFKGKGAGVRVTMDNPLVYDNLQPYKNYWQLISFTKKIKLMLIPRIGKLKVDAPWEGMKSKYIKADFLPDQNDKVEFMIEEFLTSWESKANYEDFNTALEMVEEEYHLWLDKTLDVGDEFAETRELAAYINWSAIVNPRGLIKRQGMYMSKNHMTNVWSWDHCFNAMALIETNPQQAWDQFMFMFDHQKENGVLPDSVNNVNYIWSFVKPPIHGWTLKWMMERSDFIDGNHLEEIYQPLMRWTNWWFKYRDSDQDGIPEYDHGNDSGWDNSTIFHAGAPVEAPDLSAFLVIQLEVLGDIAVKLGKLEEASVWKVKSRTLLERLLNHSWQDNRFVAPYSGSHDYYNEGDTLLLYIPLILGQRLPFKIRDKLISGLKEENRFYTENGLTTESTNSDFYEPDGYWRGPIWAPSTMIMVEALKQSGAEKMATDVAAKFCQMARRSGMAENYDAITGDGLRDRAYTWTSSVFLILANQYIR